MIKYRVKYKDLLSQTEHDVGFSDSVNYLRAILSLQKADFIEIKSLEWL